MTENKDQAEKDFTAFVLQCLEANEMGDGILYAVLNDGRFVFNKSSQEWMSWQGHFWELDEMDNAHIEVDKVVEAYIAEAHNLVDGINTAIKAKDESTTKKLRSREAQIFKRAKRLNSDRGRINCLGMAHKNKQRPLAILGEHLDQSPWLLACANGVVDLRTGNLQPGRPSDYLTKASPTEWDDIDAQCPIWEKTLSEIFAGEPELVAYMARLFGYALTGVPKENILPILWGQGRNGKTTIVETISHILGPLAAPIQSEMLLDQGHSRSSAGPSPDIMALRGLRMAFASEADEGRKFSPSRIKWMSGSDTLVGRAPHDKRQTSFRPTHTLMLLTNHKPHAPSSDFAFWERIHLIPFNYSFVDRPLQKDNERPADKDLTGKLEAEGPGILAWLVRGCISWQQMGLHPPDIIKDATDEYRRDEDLLADFIEERCFVHKDAWVNATALYDNFLQWFEKNVSKRKFSQKNFGKLLKDRFEKEKKGTVIYHGLRLLEP